MGVAQRADVPAVVPVGSVLLRLGYAAVDIWRRAVRETCVKLGCRRSRLMKRA